MPPIRNLSSLEHRDLKRIFRKLIFEAGYDSSVEMPIVDMLDAAAAASQNHHYRTVPSAAARNAIPADERVEGMRVFVTGLSREFTLIGGAWKQTSHRFDLEGRGGQVFIYVDPAGSDDTGDGSVLSPYASIERATVDIPPHVARPIVIQLAVGNYGVAFSGRTPRLDLNAHSSDGRNWDDFSYPPIETSPAVILRGAALSTENVGASINATVDAADPTVLDIQFAAPVTTTFVAGELMLQDSYGSYYPVVSITGDTVRVVTYVTYGTAYYTGVDFTLKQLGTRFKGLEMSSSAVPLYAEFVAFDTGMTTLVGAVTANGCTCKGANAADDFFQMHLYDGAGLTNCHVNAVGSAGSTAENIYVYNAYISCVNVVAASEFFFEGSVSWSYVRHPVAIANKFYFRHCIVQETTNWGFYFDGAGTAVRCESVTFIKRGKYARGPLLTRFFDIIDTSLKFEAGTNIGGSGAEGGVATVRALSRISNAANFNSFTSAPTSDRPFLVDGAYVGFTGLPNVNASILSRIE